jgi:hypothetical protein
MMEYSFAKFLHLSRSNNPKIPHTSAQLQLQIRSSGRGWSKLQFGKQTYHTVRNNHHERKTKRKDYKLDLQAREFKSSGRLACITEQRNNLTTLPVNSLYIMGEAYTQLELNIISAQDLKKIHLFGMMQTYGVVWINFEKKLTTQIDRTGGANPTWNDKAIFRVEERFLRSETSTLMVEIYCVGCLRDTLVGTVRVLLSNLLKGYRSKDFSGMSFSALQVCHPSGHPHGILNLGTMILDGLDLHRMNRFIPSIEGGCGLQRFDGESCPTQDFICGEIHVH